MEIVKVPPPAEKGGRHRVDWDAVAERLVANPGQWGVIHDVARSQRTAIKRGEIAAMRPPEHWEATTRGDSSLGRSRGTLYVRYIGGR